MLHDVLTAPKAQDVHISCPIDLVETLVGKFERQFAINAAAEVYDWGQSLRFQQGFVIVSWQGSVPAAFEAQLDADSRLEGHSIYILAEQEPLMIAPPRVLLSLEGLAL